MAEQPTTCLYHLLDHGLIRVTGPEAASFLQGQLSCDVSQLNERLSRLGSYGNSQGRTLATLRLFYWQDSYYLRLPRSMVPATLLLLQKYAIFSKATLTDASDSLASFGYLSAGTEFLDGSILPTHTDQQITTDKYVMIRCHGALPRYELLAEPNALLNQITDTNSSRWRQLEIQAGIATVYPQTKALFLPLQLNYQQLNGISFKKGCYIGQEIIARAHYRGQLKQRLYHIQLTNTPVLAPGDTLFGRDNHPLGTVIETVLVGNQQQGLAVLLDAAVASHLPDCLAVQPASSLPQANLTSEH